MRPVDWTALGSAAVTVFAVGHATPMPLIALIALTGGVTAILYAALATWRDVRTDSRAFGADLRAYLDGRMDVEEVLRRVQQRSNGRDAGQPFRLALSLDVAAKAMKDREP